MRASLARPVAYDVRAPYEQALLHLDRARAMRLLGEREAELDEAVPVLQRLRAEPSLLRCQEERAALGLHSEEAGPVAPPLSGHEL